MDHGLAAFTRWYEEDATEEEREQITALLRDFEQAETEEEKDAVARRARVFPLTEGGTA